MKRLKRILTLMIIFTVVVTTIPETMFTESYAAVGTDARVADGFTLDSWKQYFGESNNFTTRYAGRVWTDKSVLKDASAFSYAKELADGKSTLKMDGTDNRSFLVSLSAMASSESIVGQANKPTDTMIILDLSSSMYHNQAQNKNLPDTVNTMFNAVNDTIKKLQDLNVNNRVGVTIYYGGPDLNQAPKNSYQVLLPLDRYTHSSSKYLKATTSNGILTKVGVNSNVKRQSTNKTVSASRTVPDVSGTYTQQGILSALKQFMSADTIVPANAEYQAGTERTPVMVIMSDGEPTAATSQYTKLDVEAEMGSNAVAIRSAAETDFLTQLTTAYAKAMMDAHYVKETPIVYTLSLVGQEKSVSYDVMDPANTLKKAEFKPSTTISGYWDSLLKNDSISITAKIASGQWDSTLKNKKVTVSKTTVNGKKFPSSKSQMYYVDKAFEANTLSTLTDAFENIYADISVQTHNYPTLVTDNENLDGYISFIDRIGKYMHVTDVKGILIGNSWYSGQELSKNFVSGGGNLGTYDYPASLGDEMVQSVQKRLGIADAQTARALISLAYEYGQLSYNKNTGEYSNYIGWYADANGNYLGFWHEGSTTQPAGAVYKMKCYGYLGEADESHGVKSSDLMYATVQVRTNISTGEETVTFAVPAALIPTVEYDVKLDENGKPESVTRGGAEKPIRLVYEVALDDAINGLTVHDPSVVDANYVESNTNQDGSVNFYTNQYEADKTTGYGTVNTYSYFRPAHTNENYYFQENMTIYTDQKGTLYKKDSAPVASGTYYHSVKYYTKSGNTISEKTEYRQLSAAALDTAKKNSDNTWYIPQGNVLVNLDGYTIAKTSNATVTLPNANSPYVDVNGHNVNEAEHRFVIGDTLGNNGRISVVPETGLKISKSVENGGTSASEKSFAFTITSEEETDGQYAAARISKNGEASSETVSFHDGTAAVNLKDGESLHIIGLTAGRTYTVREAEDAEYVLSGITVDGADVNGSEAAVTTRANAVTGVHFTNEPRGTSGLIVAKKVEHSLGDGYSIPADKVFNVSVKLEGIAIADGQEFNVKHSGNAELKKASLQEGSLSFQLRDGESVEIFDIPEGTIAKVIETDQEAGFTASYMENFSAGDGEITVGKEPAVDTITVVNRYKPEPVKVNINLSGRKILEDAAGNEIPKGNWGNLSFEFIIQEYVYDDAAGEWKWKDATADSDTADYSDDTVDFLPGGKVLTFDKVGTYGYQVIEKNHGQTIGGITYDSTMHTFDVIVTDQDMDGKLEATVKSSHGEQNSFSYVGNVWVNDDINFTNINKQGHTSLPIMIEKKVTNLGGGMVSLAGYQFELYETNQTYTISGDPVQTSEKTDAAGETYVTLEYDYGNQGSTTHYYVLKEKASGIQGMTDDASVYKFKVVVTSEDNGTVTAVASSEGEPEFGTFNSAAEGVTYPLAVFTNTYDPEDAEVSLHVTKTLKNLNLKGGDFEFKLSAETLDAPMPEGAENGVKVVTNAAPAENETAGNVDFGKIKFDAVGTYHYTVQEVIGSDNRIDYDETVYDVVITVTDNNGKLNASVVVVNDVDNEINFVNEFTPTPTSVVIEGTKNYNRSMVNDMFRFTLEETDSNGNVKEQGVKLTAENTLEGHFSFDPIDYTEEGTYHYAVKEAIPDQTHGIVYDKAVYMVKVNVSCDPGTGKLTASRPVITKNGTDADSIVFSNEYHAASAKVDIPGFKVLNGKTLENGQFRFNLYKAEDSWTKTGNALKTVTNDAEGVFVFSDIEFDAAGTYRYIIEEVNGGQTVDHITYDGKQVGVIVNVADDGRGHLEAEVNYVEFKDAEETQAGAVVFTNEYKPVSTTLALTANKVLTGKTLEAGEFSFLMRDAAGQQVGDIVTNKVTDGQTPNITFDPVTFTAAGVYTYTVREVNGGLSENGVDYDAAVYTVTVTVLDTNGVLSIGSTEITKPGTDGSAQTVSEIEFNNNYEPEEAKLALKAVKLFSGRELKEGESFAFELKDEFENVLQTKTGIQSGIFFFDALEYGKEDVGEHYYTISEVIPEDSAKLPGIAYDQNVFTVKVDVQDDGKGELNTTVNLVAEPDDEDKDSTEILIPYDPAANQMVFQNGYTAAKTSVVFKTSKELTGKTLAAEEFTFELKDEAGQTVCTAKNDAEGNVIFETIDFARAGRYTYTISEVNDGKTGITYDSSEHTFTILVKDDTATGQMKAYLVTTDGEVPIEDGTVTDTAAFSNTYKAGSATVNLYATKTLQGKTLEAGMFDFKLTGEDDAPMPAAAVNGEVTAANDAAGRVDFGSVTYSEAGTYKYIVKEIIPEDSEKIPGVTYDDKEKTVTVVVTDNGNGGLNVTVNGQEAAGGAANAAAITNTYAAASTGEIIQATKQMIGKDGNQKEMRTFSFVLLDENGQQIGETENDKSGNITFPEITYDAPGVYNYTLHEVNGGTRIDGVDYDPSVYSIQVVVTDIGGELKAVTSFTKITGDPAPEAENMVFTNVYDAENVHIALKGCKRMEGKGLSAGDYEFKLTAEGDSPLYDDEGKSVTERTVTNAADGFIMFPQLVFEKTGTYSYTISEVNGGKGGITYDATVYPVTVEVTDSRQGYLEANVKVKGAEYDPESDPEDIQIVFTNEYKASPASIDFTVTKYLNNKNLAENMFKFVLKDSAGAEIATATNDADGTVKFEDVTFNEAGTYVYTISEVTDAPLGGVYYDPAVLTVTVEVTDNEAGNLVVNVISGGTMNEEGTAIDAGSFTNVYTTANAYLDLYATKVLEGRALQDGEFTFELKEVTDPDNPVLLQTKTNVANGTVRFDSIEYGTPGEHTYTITEVIPTEAVEVEKDGKICCEYKGVTYNPDDTVLTVSVKVEDNGNGQLEVKDQYTNEPISGAVNAGEIRNIYTADGSSVIIQAFKKLDGRALKDGEFTFVLTDTSEPVVLQTVTNQENGNIVFDKIRFTEAGTWHYTVHEEKGSLTNVNYDDSVFDIIVKVVDNGDGTMTVYDVNDVEITEAIQAGTFENKYSEPYIPVSKDVYVPISAAKVMEGRSLTAGEFTFELTDQAGNVIQTKTNSSGGQILFSSLHFDQAGTYVYNIREVAGSEEGVTYDTSVHNVMIVVSETAWGSLTAQTWIDGAADGKAVFTNYYGELPPEEPEDPEEPDNPDNPDEPDTPDAPDEPGIPENPGKPNDPDDDYTDLDEDTPYAGADPDHPKTGDESNLLMWLLVFAVSGMGAAGTWTLKRKMK